MYLTHHNQACTQQSQSGMTTAVYVTHHNQTGPLLCTSHITIRHDHCCVAVRTTTMLFVVHIIFSHNFN